MFHHDCIWNVSPRANAEKLARKLTKTTIWCCCTGFALGEYLWLNESASPDGAQEYGIVKNEIGSGSQVQIESITFGWCNKE
ncbi:MAG: hypothetical protein JWM11_3899 [Planctomycetaceae bacterium]|nr:hypothetical protein [Planctomycetaceae bacterium]